VHLSYFYKQQNSYLSSTQNFIVNTNDFLFERADVLPNEGPISGTLFQDRAGLITVNTSDIHSRARTRMLTEWQERWNDSEMGRYCYSILPRVLVETWMASAVDERVFLVAMSSLASNHTGTWAHLQKINVVQDAL
jgi:hypothetical protein